MPNKAYTRYTEQGIYFVTRSRNKPCCLWKNVKRVEATFQVWRSSEIFPILSWAGATNCPVNMPVWASTGPVLAHYGMFMGWSVLIKSGLHTMPSVWQIQRRLNGLSATFSKYFYPLNIYNNPFSTDNQRQSEPHARNKCTARVVCWRLKIITVITQCENHSLVQK